VFKQQLKTAATTAAGAAGAAGSSASPSSKDRESPAYKTALATAEAAAAKHAIAKDKRARKAKYALYWPVEKMRAAYLSLQEQRAKALGLPLEKHAEDKEDKSGEGRESSPSPLPGARGFGGRKQNGEEQQQQEREKEQANAPPDTPTPWKKIEKFPLTLPVMPAVYPLIRSDTHLSRNSKSQDFPSLSNHVSEMPYHFDFSL